jgi:hypothetical protein
LISYKNFHIAIKSIIEENYFNIEEYQDKYYFTKKVQEFFPRIPDELIFNALNSFNDNSSPGSVKTSIQYLTHLLYAGALKFYEGRITSIS